MFVINSDDKIEYVASSPTVVENETEKLFYDTALLFTAELDSYEIFYYAALIHLVFVKIHPFQDGNGRTARLLEKWFLLQKIGQRAVAVQHEKIITNKLRTIIRILENLDLNTTNRTTIKVWIFC